MSRQTPETPQTIFFNNVGWGPKETMNVVHKSLSAEPLKLFNPERWDVVNEGANPHGIWYTINQGVERTAKNSTPEKAVKAANTRKMFAKRPYTHEGELTLDKPMITVGDVPDRSYLSYYVDNAGADGLIYNDIYDNGYNHAREVLSYKLHDN
jgi:hypothetical protein